MPFDGTGNFQPLSPPQYPAVPDTEIIAAYFNAVIDNIHAGLTSLYGFGTSRYEVLTATTPSQTVFTLSLEPGPGNNVSLFVDGISFVPVQDFAISGSTLTLTGGVDVGTSLLVRYAVALPQGASDAATATYLAATTGAVPRTVQDKLREVSRSLEDFGGAADGVTDNLAAWTKALASGAKVIRAPAAGSYRFSAGITIPVGVSLEGGLFLPDGALLGTVLLFDLAVPTCVTLGGSGAANRTGDISRVTITRAAGSIPAGSIGLLVQNCYGVDIRDLQVMRQAIPVALKGDGTVNGILANFDSLYTGAATDTHIEIDTFPEVRITNSRLGMNGAFDQACNSYIRVKGGSTVNAANGPNTLVCSNMQFSQGSGAFAAAWVEFKNQLPGNIADLSSWQFESCLVETATVGIKSDATWTNLLRLQFSNLIWNMNATYELFALNAATRISNWTLSNCIINGKVTLAPSGTVNFLNISNVQILGLASFTGPDNGSIASISNCNFQGGLTLAGTWASLQVKGGAMSSGSFTNTATSPVSGVSIDLYPMNAQQTFTPVLQFGGVSTGISYNLQIGAWSYDGNKVYGQLRLILQNKGGVLPGAPTIVLTGLPQPVIAAAYTTGNSGGSANAFNMAGLSSPVFGTVGAGPVLNLYQYGATGIASLSQANFTNSTDLAIAFEYYFN